MNVLFQLLLLSTMQQKQQCCLMMCVMLWLMAIIALQLLNALQRMKLSSFQKEYKYISKYFHFKIYIKSCLCVLLPVRAGFLLHYGRLICFGAVCIL